MFECSNCVKRIKTISANDLQIKCGKCSGYFHASCVNLKKDDVDYYLNEGKPWICALCTANYTNSNNSEAQVYNVLLDKLNEINKTMRHQEDMLRDFRAHMDHRLKTIEGTLLQKINTLTVENRTLKQSLTTVTNRLETIEQKSRATWVELHGIPEIEGLSPLNTAVELFNKCLNMNVTHDDISSCFRIKSKPIQQKAGGSNQQNENSASTKTQNKSILVVKFYSLKLKMQVMKGKIKNAKSMNTGIYNLKKITPIFINESLIAPRRRLFALSKQAKKNKGYHSAFTANGVIMLKKHKDDDDVVIINSIDDLEKLK